MNFKFEERPYVGKSFRPRPEIHFDERSNLLIVATPWGPRAAARKAINRMNEYLAMAREDREATSPFQRLSGLSTQANNLRIATLLANDVIYREDNRQEYRSGVELFATLADEGELVWLQTGNPQILLARPGRSFLPLGSQMDLSFDLSEEQELLPALPAQLLGLDLGLNITINSFRAREGDQILLLSHSHLPETVFQMDPQKASLDSVSQALAQARPNDAFWLGLLKLEKDLS